MKKLLIKIYATLLFILVLPMSLALGILRTVDNYLFDRAINSWVYEVIEVWRA